MGGADTNSTTCTSGARTPTRDNEFLFDGDRRAPGLLRIPENKKAKHFLNIAFLGAEGLGKTTSIFALLHIYGLKKEKLDEIVKKHRMHEPTKEVQAIEIGNDDELPGSNVVLSFLDFPGYNVSTGAKWLTTVEDTLRSRIHAYSDRKSRYVTGGELSDEEKKMCSCNVDERIHLAIFFIGPHSRISDFDIQVMTEVRKKANLTVVIAKSDAMTTAEAKGLDLYKPFDADTDVNVSAHTSSCNEGAFGPVPPYSIVSSREFNHEGELSRVYNWGTCRVEDGAHSDLCLLREALFSESFYRTLEETDRLMRSYNASQREERQRREEEERQRREEEERQRREDKEERQRQEKERRRGDSCRIQ
eukprot:tig00020704_g13185.t1